jgi:ribosomal protein S2, bacterial type
MSLARALLKLNDGLREVFKKEGMLTRDARKKERMKYGKTKRRRSGSIPNVEEDYHKYLQDTETLLKKLLEVGAHYGHRTSRWNPKMKPFIYTAKEGIHIIDIRYTAVAIKKAYELMRREGARGGRVLFVSTKPQAKSIIKKHAERVGAFYVVERWLGGMLTNFETIYKRILKMKEYENLFEQIERLKREGKVLPYPKKEILKMQREYIKLKVRLGGIRDMDELPNLVFIVDPKYNDLAAHECKLLKIPTIGIVDTNADPTSVDLPIPANDESMKSIDFIVGIVSQGYLDGKMARESKGG